MKKTHYWIECAWQCLRDPTRLCLTECNTLGPPAGTEIIVTLTITDGGGYSMFAFFDDHTVSAQVATLRMMLCELIARIRSEEIWHWPINPLGPDPGPEGIADRADYAAIRELAEQVVRVTENLKRLDRQRV